MLKSALSLFIGVMLGTLVVSAYAMQPCETPTPEPSELGTTRSNPVPLGEWLSTTAGQFRVVSAVTLSDVVGQRFDGSRPEGNEQLLAVTVELTCESEEEACDLWGSVNPAKHVTVEGVVNDLIGTSDYLSSASITGDFDDMYDEVYAPNTLSGVLYFDLQEGETVGLLRTEFFYSSELFFSLTED